MFTGAVIAFCAGVRWNSAASYRTNKNCCCQYSAASNFNHNLYEKLRRLHSNELRADLTVVKKKDRPTPEYTHP